VTLRLRLALWFGGVVAAILVVGLVTTFTFSQTTIEESVDNRLRDEARDLDQTPPPNADRLRGLGNGGSGGRGDNRRAADRFRDRFGRVQLIDLDGTTFGAELPMDDALLERVRSTGTSLFSNQTADDGTVIRIFTVALNDGRIAQLTADTTPVSAGFDTVRRALILSGVLGVAAAALLGWFVAGRFTQPITDVTHAARTLARNQDLPSRIEVNRSDEVGDLATSFNHLLTELEVSRQQQSRLVADASHELRTPLTSLRMKVDFLAREPDLPAAKRQEIVGGAAVELESLTELVTELVQLASHSAVDDEPESLNVGQLVTDVASRAQIATGRTITVSTTDSMMTVRPKLVRRAVSNLIDNAHKYSPASQPIEVHEQNGRIEVRDHGPGIAQSDQPYAFERFFRSDTARTQPGSGIGLAMVRQAAERHHGETWVSNATDGGARVGFSVTSLPEPAPRP